MSSGLPRRLVQELLIFATTARAKTFSAAAREMGVTQSAVSHAVARLERELGVPLFVRRWRGAEPTAAGEVLLEAVERGARAMAEGVNDIRRLVAAGTSLTIVTDFGFAALWLMPRLEQMRAIAPSFDIHILTTQSTAAPELSLGDAAIVFAPEAPAAWDVTSIGPELVTPVASPSFLARTPHWGLDDLRKAPLLHLDVTAERRWVSWEDYFRAIGEAPPEPEKGIALNNYPVLIQAAIAGQGVALGWEPLVTDLLRRNILAPAGAALHTGRPGYAFIIPRSGRAASTLLDVKQWILAETAAG
jgi:DNA-binding transcriptional LysR family regulator